ncbi:hypothetical protein HRbin29_00122 [bacterium HR29]|jgi:hypothetical protein|nr:hypothetical protein HRbin29_00122 [bacterium HR29]
MSGETLTPFPAAGTPCAVCGESIPHEGGAYCEGCGEPFHLAQRAGLESRDCGRVWISEEHLGLVFGCDRCLAPPSDALDDVLDLEEAALLARVEAAVLQAAALAGELAHRRTSGGSFLFLRRDVTAWAARRGSA